MMDDITIARAVHVLAVTHWIGGVAFVTLVILPAISRMAEPVERFPLFEKIEGRFAFQARVSVILAGLSGFYMTHSLGAWERFADPGYWWMHAMVLLWAVFAAILFVAEPLFVNAWVRRRAARDTVGAFRFVRRAHVFLLVLSLLTVGAGVLGSHGMLY